MLWSCSNKRSTLYDYLYPYVSYESTYIMQWDRNLPGTYSSCIGMPKKPKTFKTGDRSFHEVYMETKRKTEERLMNQITLEMVRALGWSAETRFVEDCHICLERINLNERGAISTPCCDHYVHIKCIRRWRREKRRKGEEETCAYCRRPWDSTKLCFRCWVLKTNWKDCKFRRFHP